MVTVKLAGKVGTATYYRTDTDGKGKGPIELITIAGTEPAAGKPVAAALRINSPPIVEAIRFARSPERK